VVRRYPPLQGDITEHRWLLPIFSSHASFDAIPLPNRVFPQPVQPGRLRGIPRRTNAAALKGASTNTGAARQQPAPLEEPQGRSAGHVLPNSVSLSPAGERGPRSGTPGVRAPCRSVIAHIAKRAMYAPPASAPFPQTPFPRWGETTRIKDNQTSPTLTYCRRKGVLTLGSTFQYQFKGTIVIAPDKASATYKAEIAPEGQALVLLFDSKYTKVKPAAKK
jgi:hypothetical protein